VLLGNPPVEENPILELLLDNAKEIICEIRFTDNVEPEYLSTQVAIAIELYNKMGAEGETGHNENGMSRSYENADVSKSLISRITPFGRSPFGVRRTIV
jgi:hypothetical protein